MTQELLTSVMEIVITALLPVLTAYAVALIKRQIKKLEVNSTIESASNIVLDAVVKTQQVYVNELKKQGSFDIESQKKAFEDTKSTAKELFTDSTKKIITETFGDLEKWLDLKIEAAVKETK